MKRALFVFVMFAVSVATVACRPPRDRSDWRAPVTARPCKADTDCPAGSSCAIELGASQGTCFDPDAGAGSSTYPYGPRGPDSPGPDGGAGPQRAPGPPINAQPQPGDINI
ncbi:MAG: hypothetical protein JST00_35490 [Deltaproteobacteria bacterium]|nr:hypothetical protein [Deltaproteobacteria bacterium]